MSTLILFLLVIWFAATWFMASQLSLAEEGDEGEFGFGFSEPPAHAGRLQRQVARHHRVSRDHGTPRFRSPFGR